MAKLNLVKLCVGVDTVEDLQAWRGAKRAEAHSHGREYESYHVTRMFPKQADALLDGGSLYWVIKGKVQCRQRLIGLDPVVGKDGIRRCKIVMNPKLTLTEWQPRRAFQGWRYLKVEDAPPDMSKGQGDVPAALKSELAELGLL